MADLNNIFRLFRIAIFGLTSVFAFIVIVLGGLVTNFSNVQLRGYYPFAALGIATGLLTVLTLPVMLALSLIRKGAVTSLIVVELAWTWFLWIMWIAVGGSSVGYFTTCSLYIRSTTQAACNESTAITAFGFLSWILLMIYNTTLITLAFRQHLRGNSGVWTKDITETDFNAVGSNPTQPVYDSKATFAPQYPPTNMGTPVSAAPQIAYPQQVASPQPHVPSPYIQPQATGPFTHPQGGTSPYPQV